VYCENCGLQVFQEHPYCTRCGAAPTHQWLQFVGLLVLLLTIIGNSVVGWLLLPSLVATHRSSYLFRGWLWTDQKVAEYGWVPIAVGLLAWEFFVWRKIRRKKTAAKVKGWVSRKILTFVLAMGFAPILPWWLPAGQPSDKTLAALSRYPGLPCVVSWSAMVVVAVVLGFRGETRDRLLGRGKALLVVSLSALALFLGLTVFGWSRT
jgi:hypothetical protein